MNTPQTDEELIEAFDEMFLSDKTFTIQDIGRLAVARNNQKETQYNAN